ncbi:MAG: hypothetical protein ABI885_21370 [Gammaproteobacteria bacterium]
MAAVLLTVGIFDAHAETARPPTQENVNAWLDGSIPSALQAADIPGGVVVIVKDGEILTEPGCGHSLRHDRGDVGLHGRFV